MQNLQNLTEQELILAYQTGNDRAMDMLTKQTYKRTYTALYLMVKDKYIVEDLLQETYIKALAQIRSGNYNNEGKFSAWLNRVAHNLCMDYFRATRKNVKVKLSDGRDIFDYINIPEENVEDKRIATESGNRARNLVNELPEEQRNVLVMRIYAKMSFAEIAEETGVTLNTALGRMRYALLNLRKLVQDRQLVL